jgi:hypothetical protein
MITQSAIGLNSRSEANPFDENGFLPILTAPMSSVVNETNYQEFHTNNIQICFPRTANMDEVHNDVVWKDSFHSMSLQDFYDTYISNPRPIGSRPQKRCIDTANGNMPQLHEAIREAKKIHGDSLVIMAGNVSSVESFVKLAETGVDYIRVGIGGGGNCNTTKNTGVGHKNLQMLINECKYRQKLDLRSLEGVENEGFDNYYQRNGVRKGDREEVYTNQKNIAKVKIVADGISTYIKWCEETYGFNDNGYAAINNLLFAGADLVMVGKLFAQCLESAGEKAIDTFEDFIVDHNRIRHYQLFYGDNVQQQSFERFHNGHTDLVVRYSGMSTQEEQKKYKKSTLIYGSSEEGKAGIYKFPEIKPSEGSVQWIPVRWTLDAWLNGSQDQDSYPYLMGWVNSIKSAMAYTGSKTLNEFKQ